MLYEHLTAYQKQDIYPFHMPGHKRNPAFLPPDLPALDVTEFNGMDNLHAPAGLIKELNEKIARVYASDESFMLVNGSSSGLVAAMCAAFREGEAVYIDRRAHQSVFHGLALCGAVPVYTFSAGTKHAVITSPTYEGFTKDVQAYARVVHQNGGVLLVDEAHGAHFPFHNIFPRPAMARGADIAVTSFHKTLPGLSQTAALHVRGGAVDRDRLKFYLRVTQTSSPSYIFMAATDYFLDMLTGRAGYFESYVSELVRVRSALKAFASLRLVDGFCACGGRKDLKSCLPPRGALADSDSSALHTGVAYDVGKLLFEVNAPLSGHEVMRRMAEKYRVQLEMATEDTVLAMTSVADTREGFTRLVDAVAGMNAEMALLPTRAAREKKKYSDTASPFGEKQARVMPAPCVVLTPCEALKREAKVIPLNEAEGCVAAEFITEYPPGIPLLVPGERITAEVKGFIKQEYIKVSV